MRIKSISVRHFKRFTNLTVPEIPPTSKLVILVGPNGSGKSSLFEALNHWQSLNVFGRTGEESYFRKNQEAPKQGSWYENLIDLEFHGLTFGTPKNTKGKFYFRTAYRNESDFTIQNLSKQSDPTESYKLATLAQNDLTVSENYQRLISQTLNGVFDPQNGGKTVENLREELIGKIQKSLSMIFGDLNLASVGDPLINGSFYFEKGASKDFHYKNLSAGEKSVFDLVLDLIVKSSYFPNSIYCIDEPEAHMHTALQSIVLQELYNLVPETSQLWIATHSIGMLKKASDIELSKPGTVTFLDLSNRDFDTPQIITPSAIDSVMWEKFASLAFGDFSKLIAPDRIVFCEGTSKGRAYKDFDAQIYGAIFVKIMPTTKFISIGSCSELENLANQTVSVTGKILQNTQVIKFIDRDGKSDPEVVEANARGIKVSKMRNIECYLLDDEIIMQLCKSLGKENLIPDCLAEKQTAIAKSVARGNPLDDIKSASGEIFVGLKRILSLPRAGNTSCAFLRDTMTPLVTQETEVYKTLYREIFE